MEECRSSTISSASEDGGFQLPLVVVGSRGRGGQGEGKEDILLSKGIGWLCYIGFRVDLAETEQR